MAEKGDPFDVHPALKQAMEQSAAGMDQCFEFLKKNLAAFPTGGTELGEKLKEYTDKNLTSAQEMLKSIGEAKDFQDVMKIQTEFMQSQFNAFGEQAKGFAEAYTKATTDTEKNAGGSVKEMAMDEVDDQRQLFGDLAATVRQGVEQVRGIEENFYAAVHWGILPLPWVADVSERLQSYVEQHFKNGFDYALELSQAKDFQEFTLINGRGMEKSLASPLAQAKDFTETHTSLALCEKSPVPLFTASA